MTHFKTTNSVVMKLTKGITSNKEHPLETAHCRKKKERQ